MIESAMDRMRDLIESSGSREKMRLEGEEFANKLSDEILQAKDLTDAE